MRKRGILRTAAAMSAWTMITGVASFNPSLLAEEPQTKQQVKVIVLSDDDEQEKKTDGEQVQEVEVRVNVDSAEQSEGPKLWLGIMLKEVEGDLARYLGSDDGILVDAVYDDSPAAKAGVQEGDLLLRADAKVLESPSVLLEILGDMEEGDSIKLDLLRKGKKEQVQITPGPRPDMEELELLTDKDDVLHLNLKELENVDGSLRKALKAIRLPNGDNDLKVFSFGGPAFAWRGAGDSGELDVEIVREVDGNEMKIKITRQDDEEAQITVTRDGETQEYSEDDLKDLPDNVAKIVQQHLKSGAVQRFEVQVMPQLEALNIEIDEQELAERAREMAEKYREAAERARGSAEVLRSRIKARAESGEEIGQLKALVEELRAEVAELKSKLKDK